MARRTTPNAVRTISDIPTSVSLEGFIDTATKIVDKLSALDTGADLDEQQLELIERWLTAHMVATTVHRESTMTMKQIDITKAMWSDTYKDAGGGLSATPYGQQAMALDTSNHLEDLYGERVWTGWVGDDDPDG